MTVDANNGKVEIKNINTNNFVIGKDFFITMNGSPATVNIQNASIKCPNGSFYISTNALAQGYMNVTSSAINTKDGTKIDNISTLTLKNLTSDLSLKDSKINSIKFTENGGKKALNINNSNIGSISKNENKLKLENTNVLGQIILNNCSLNANSLDKTHSINQIYSKNALDIDGYNIAKIEATAGELSLKNAKVTDLSAKTGANLRLENSEVVNQAFLKVKNLFMNNNAGTLNLKNDSYVAGGISSTNTNIQANKLKVNNNLDMRG